MEEPDQIIFFIFIHEPAVDAHLPALMPETVHAAPMWVSARTLAITVPLMHSEIHSCYHKHPREHFRTMATALLKYTTL